MSRKDKAGGVKLGAKRAQAVWQAIKAAWGHGEGVSVPLSHIEVVGVDNGVMMLKGKTYLATMLGRENAVPLKQAAQRIEPRIKWVTVGFPDNIAEEEIEDFDETGKCRRQMVRRKQSPILTLHNKSPDFFDKRLLVVADCYYADWIRAQISPIGTPDFNRVSRSGHAYDLSAAKIAAIQRLARAHEAINNAEMARLAELVILREKPLRQSERAMAMRNGRGRNVLHDALTRLADFYEGV